MRYDRDYIVEYVQVCKYFFDIFFFFKQKTAYEMRISDWSSDVCSSDLVFRREQPRRDAKNLPLLAADRLLTLVFDLRHKIGGLACSVGAGKFPQPLFRALQQPRSVRAEFGHEDPNGNIGIASHRHARFPPGIGPALSGKRDPPENET